MLLFCEGRWCHERITERSHFSGHIAYIVAKGSCRSSSSVLTMKQKHKAIKTSSTYLVCVHGVSMSARITPENVYNSFNLANDQITYFGVRIVNMSLGNVPLNRKRAHMSSGEPISTPTINAEVCDSDERTSCNHEAIG